MSFYHIILLFVFPGYNFDPITFLSFEILDYDQLDFREMENKQFIFCGLQRSLLEQWSKTLANAQLHEWI